MNTLYQLLNNHVSSHQIIENQKCLRNKIPKAKLQTSRNRNQASDFSQMLAESWQQLWDQSSPMALLMDQMA